MKNAKIITSHRARVKKANAHIERLPERVSRIDREAFVEFYLLEDIIRLYEYRLAFEKESNSATRIGDETKKRNIAQFTALINLFQSAAECARATINSGNYTAVWKAIPERAIMKATSNVKHLPVIRKLGSSILKELSKSAMQAIEQVKLLNEDIDDLVMHEGNVRVVKGLPNINVEEIIRAAEAAVPDTDYNRKPSIR